MAEEALRRHSLGFPEHPVDRTNTLPNPGAFSISVSTAGDTVTAEVTGQWSQVGLPIMFIPNGKVIRGHAVMRKESL